MLGELIGPVSGLLDKVIPDKDQAAKLAHEIATMSEKHAQEAMLAQLEINKAEAASGSVFKGGWRPAVGWVCVLAMLWTYIIQPFVVFTLTVAGVDMPPLPELNMSDLMPVLMGMLGLGAMRSYEKSKGVAAK